MSFELKNLSGQTVVVAMSGGVDSAAAAILLNKAGAKVVGVSMQVWDYRAGGGNASRATCCSPADFNDAREVAEKADFPFYVFDFEDSFSESVINPFVKSYLEGKTPNPCLECNRKVKFRELRKRASGLGAEFVATGHYAQVKDLPSGEKGLFTGADQNKDQSYFLYAMKESELQKTLFPVGDMEKPEVRQLLSDSGISIAEKPESQDICFVAGRVGDFIEKHSGVIAAPGPIVNVAGKILGQHDGIHNYTVGQRKGLGISNPEPLYVLEIDAESNSVRVGEKQELERSEFFVENLSWVSEAVSGAEPIEVLAKLRYRHQGVRSMVYPLGSGQARVEFLSDWSTVSPGQAAVFYETETDAAGDRRVLGGGTISANVSH